MEYKLELVLIPVGDVDRAKAFYESLGFHCDVDHHPSESFRVVQFTPPGSGCSIAFGVGILDTEPGAVQGLHLVVRDVEAAREDLAGRGIEISGVRHMGPTGWVPGVDQSHADYASYADFSDPDGNGWLLQEVGHASAD